LRQYLIAVGEDYTSPIEDVFNKEQFQKYYQVRLAGLKNKQRQSGIRTANSYIQGIRSFFSRHFIETYPFELPGCVRARTKLSKPRSIDNTQYTLKEEI
jgi:hypothetical protein